MVIIVSVVDCFVQFIILLFFFFFIFNRNERNCTIWSYANRFYYCKRSKTHRTWQPCCAMLVQSAITVLISVATKYSRSRIDVWQRITRIVAFVVIIYSCSFFINLNFFQLVWNFIFLYFFFSSQLKWQFTENISLLSS